MAGTTPNRPAFFLNDEWVKSSDGKTITSINPTYVSLSPPEDTSNPPTSDESQITSVYAASASDIDRAVAAARKAFKDPVMAGPVPNGS